MEILQSEEKPGVCQFCDAVLYLAWKDGRPVGRIMGIINRKFNEHRKENIARFACLETAEDRKSSTPSSARSRIGPGPRE